MIAASAAKTARMDAANRSCCWPWTPGSAEPALSAAASPCPAGFSCLLLLNGWNGASRTFSPGDAFEALLAACPARDRRRLRAVLADVDHAAAMPCGEGTTPPQRAGCPWDVRWHSKNPSQAGKPAGCQHRQPAGALQRSPAISIAGVWICLHTARLVIVSHKLEAANRLRERPSASRENPR